MEVIIETNQFQTPITRELLDKYPQEVQEEFMDLVQNVPFIKNLISKDRPWVKDLPKDEKGRAIIDLSNPPLYDNSDYFRPAAKFYEKNKCYTFLKPNSNPNSEFRKFWDREMDRCYNGMLRDDGMWISGQMYWNLNYCPMLVNMPVPGTNKAIRKESLPWFFEGIWWRFLYLDMARQNGHHAIELAKRGAHPYTQKVLTPQGEKLWGDIKVGDELFSTYGTITKVTGVPVDKEYDYVYELTLQDGRTVQATYDHLFNLYINSPKFLKLFSYKVCYDCMTIDLFLNYVKEDISLWMPTAYRFIRGKRRTVSKYMKIVKCTKIEGKQKCKCVTVDSKDHCYLIGDNVPTHNCGKSYTLASIMTHNLILGESEESRKRNITVLTAYQKEYLAGDKDGTLSKFKPELPFIADNTPFPRLYLKQSSDNMTWQMGYKDTYGREKGSFNQVMAVSAKDDSDKLRGKRGYILFEEFGNFPNLLELYDVTRKSTEDGGYTFSLMFLIGTANNKESNFESAKTLLYAPESYNIQSIPNLYDKKGQGKERFGFFFGAHVNRLGCFNKDGISDVVKALLQILMQRYKAKHGADPSSVLRVIAEDPITPAEAIIKVRTSYFPTVALGERANELDTNPNSYDRVLIGSLAFKNGNVSFIPTSDTPIRKYPVPNDEKGALEIYNLPEEDTKGKVFENRYIIGNDPADNDQADSNSLMSVFVFDLFTDTIVAEYTGRQQFADQGYEIVRLLCLFYNAKCLYESNIKGCFAYFEKMNSTHLLADTPQYLRDMQMIKYNSFGSNSKGVRMSHALIDYGNRLIKDWLNTPRETVTKDENGNSITATLPTLYSLYNRALIEELIQYNPVINTDRVAAMRMVMLYRQQEIIRYQGDFSNITNENVYTDDPSYDDFFTDNFDSKFGE